MSFSVPRSEPEQDANGLREAMAIEVWGVHRDVYDAADKSLALIVNYLGITWEMVETIRSEVRFSRSASRFAHANSLSDGADALALLLEAAGVER